VQRALDEDLGRAGDITSIATIPETAPARAIMVARQAGSSPGCRWRSRRFENCRRTSGSRPTAATAPPSRGRARADDFRPARAVLAGERTALNFVGRLSGIATLTSDYVRHAAGTRLRICCTARPRRACARWKNTQCAAAAASITGSGSTTPS